MAADDPSQRDRRRDTRERALAYAAEMQRQAAADPDRGQPRIEALRRLGQNELADQYLSAWQAYGAALDVVRELLASGDQETIDLARLRSADEHSEDLREKLERIDLQARFCLGIV